MIDFIKNGSVLGAKYGIQGQGSGKHARLRGDADRRADQGHRRVREEPVMLSALLAINWELELRGMLTVIIGTSVLMGSVYLILGTNMGARLGFIVTLTGFAGWMALMGGIWWIYGIGLKGAAPEWKEVPGKTVIQEVDLLHEAGVLEVRLPFTEADDSVEASAGARHATRRRGLAPRRRVGPRVRSGRSRRHASSSRRKRRSPPVSSTSPPCTRSVARPTRSRSATRSTRSPSGTTRTTRSSRWRRTSRCVAEPGRAPIAPEVDTSMQRQYVYMVRDLGSLREPAAYICIGSTIMFLGLCWLLHRRDRHVAANLTRKALAAA